MQAHLAALLPETGGLRLIFADEAPDVLHDDHGSGERRRIKIGQGESLLEIRAPPCGACGRKPPSAVLFPSRRGANAAIIRINRGIVPPQANQPRATRAIHV